VAEGNSQGTRLGEQVCREGREGEREDWSTGFKATQMPALPVWVDGAADPGRGYPIRLILNIEC